MLVLDLPTLEGWKAELTYVCSLCNCCGYRLSLLTSGIDLIKTDIDPALNHSACKTPCDVSVSTFSVPGGVAYLSLLSVNS